MDELDRDPIILKWTRHHDLKIPYRKWWGGRGRYEPDFLIELFGGGREIREVKGDHLFGDKNTSRKLKAGEAYCREQGWKFRVITKAKVSPEIWSLDSSITIE